MTEESNDRGGRRRSEHRPNVRVTSSGHKIKGRGFVRYRTPERERSRSVTPPHWKREERRLISLEELKKRQEEQKEREQREARRINETDLDTFAARRREVRLFASSLTSPCTRLSCSIERSYNFV